MSDKNRVEKTPAASAVSGEKGKKQDLMYVGPTITGVVRYSTVFKNGILTQKARECVEEFPAMGRLFVATDKLPETMKELHKTRSVLHAVYEQTKAHFNGKGR